MPQTISHFYFPYKYVNTTLELRDFWMEPLINRLNVSHWNAAETKFLGPLTLGFDLTPPFGSRLGIAAGPHSKLRASKCKPSIEQQYRLSFTFSCNIMPSDGCLFSSILFLKHLIQSIVNYRTWLGVFALFSARTSCYCKGQRS